MSESITITIKSSGDKKYEVTVDPSITVSQLKELVAEKSDIPAGSQRLIYSGKVLKDTETVASYKVQTGHTIHLVKSAATTAAAAAAAPQSSNTPANASVPSNIAAGQGSFNPLADLTGARYAGYSQLPSASMFGPDGGMNSNIPDPEQLNSMMSNPVFQQQMQAMLSDPQMLDFMIQQNPQLRAMGPQVREMLQSPLFRQMMSNPEMLRSMMQMRGGDAGQTNAFPAPGANPTTGESGNNGAPANPFANLFPNGIPPIDPSALFGGAAPAAAPAPVDNRPPEERYESQLRQLNDMGFYDFDRNVEALRRTGGSVQGAIEYLLGGN
ncbi:ubiquitin domain-containing protein, putative [Candida dubliniensis CD36]|uniref:Ubiquitin domain-containing protein, putative n=1 Tax=Candida dubliniensis (strain CD36 / ATCC MYA-646 / CBS 7987 / NCPF 3949 / NRRL Y-17841) TaxID=573826 RepID=B9WCX5_CANDC|nr:ubiquitin domain-containing protein, putative [Candida dubliniensis CD36]CAX44250.1 ubiquitin domain-containing protein, putative [Candida dubliniensis CD36]